jgi:hypothetical protein
MPIYNPMDKNPQWGSWISDMMNNMMMMKYLSEMFKNPMPPKATPGQTPAAPQMPGGMPGYGGQKPGLTGYTGAKPTGGTTSSLGLDPKTLMMLMLSMQNMGQGQGGVMGAYPGMIR